MNLCVFQGTFNPVHNAHLRLADYVLSKYNFDKLIFIPAYKPPHKDYDDSVGYHRLKMVKLAVSELKNSKITVSDIEFHREEKSYTYVTLCELYEKFDISGKISFIIGTDAFSQIESWYEADKLKQMVKFLVFERENNFDCLKYNNIKEHGYDFRLETLPFEDVSSTVLRQRVKNGESIKDFVPDVVEDYIRQNELYRA